MSNIAHDSAVALWDGDRVVLVLELERLLMVAGSHCGPGGLGCAGPPSHFAQQSPQRPGKTNKRMKWRRRRLEAVKWGGGGERKGLRNGDGKW